MKKFLSILCALCMTMALAVPSFAVDVTTDSVATAVSESSDTSTARAPKIPTESHNLPYTAETEGLCEGCGTYTKFYFSPSVLTSMSLEQYLPQATKTISRAMQKSISMRSVILLP